MPDTFSPQASAESETVEPIDPKSASLTVQDEWVSDGSYDAHGHWDRADTFREEYFSHAGGLQHFANVPLWAKQDAVGVIHRGSAFTEECLNTRMERLIRQKVGAFERHFNGIVDCSADIEDRSFKIAIALRKKYAEHIRIDVGAYPIFGFKSFQAEDKKRYELIADLAPQAQFLIGLPERDARPEHAEIGFDRHITMMMDLSIKHQIPLHMHLDQTGLPEEDGTERFIEAVKWKVTASLPPGKRPEMWAVHVLSPASYDEARFIRLVKGLKENNIGVIVCPHAAISMRQMRNSMVPMHNSIARVFEMVLAGVKVRLGTDNLRDLFMPRPASPLLIRELDVLTSSLRFYDESIIYKLLRAEEMNNSDLVALADSLDDNYEAFGWSMRSDRFRG